MDEQVEKAAPRRRQQRRSAITQQKLLDAAIDAFSENGFKGTSTRDIAERAGVHHPLITYHFKNKELLWRAAADHVFRDFGMTLASVMAGNASASPRERLVAMIRAYLRYAQKRPAVHKVVIMESAYPNPRLDWLVDNYLRPNFEATIGPIRNLQAAGLMPAGNPAMLFHLIRTSAGGLLGLNLEMKATSGIDLDDPGTLEELTDLVIRIFLPGGGNSRSE